MLEVSVSQSLSTKFRDRRRATSGVGPVSLGGKTACISPQKPKQIQLHSSGYTISKAGLHFLCYTASRTWNHDQQHSAALSCRNQAHYHLLCSHLSWGKCETHSLFNSLRSAFQDWLLKAKEGAGWCYSPKANYWQALQSEKNPTWVAALRWKGKLSQGIWNKGGHKTWKPLLYNLAHLIFRQDLKLCKPYCTHCTIQMQDSAYFYISVCTNKNVFSEEAVKFTN